ncbi:hypothetical protein DVH05_004027 [Phytophthora capsici]|nr:hypothetical protein DVH05_016185 [Phytophthora capsici]KAG1705113.1 hypothetical protein DVH05_004027 [Phytophthora capsici]
MTVTGEEQVSELGMERLGGTDAGLGNTGTGPARQGELSMSSTDEEEGAADPSTGVRTAAGRLSIRHALRGDLEAAGDDGGTEGSEHPPAQDDVKEEVKPEPRAQEEWMISGGEEGATGDHEEMGQYAEEEAFQGEYVTDPEEGREYDIDEYGKYYLSGYYGDADEEEVKPPAQSSSGFIPLYTGAEKRRSDRPSTSWGWDPSRGAMQVQMVTVPSPTGVKSTQRVRLTGKPRTPAPPRPLGPPQMRTSVGTVGATTGRFAARNPATAPNPSSAAPPALGTVASQSTASVPRPGTVPTWMGTVPPQPRAAPAQPRTVQPGQRPSLTRRGQGSAPQQPRVPLRYGGMSSVPRHQQMYDLSSLMSNIMKVLPMFYSDTATVEKARDFWELFEAHTGQLPDRERLLVFRQKLKGREAERWWGNSRIKTFATLKVRFHNQFLSRTTDELWERLHHTKRQRGESVEEWGDRVTDLCDSLEYPNQKLRFNLFCRGLGNKRMQAALDSSPARDIPEACEWLMFKEMHRPAEEDDDFSDGQPSQGRTNQATASVDALTQQLQTFMQQQQQWQQQLMEGRWAQPRSPKSRLPTVSAVTTSPGNGQGYSGNGQGYSGNGQGFNGNGRTRGIKMAADTRTQEGEPVCGRCDYRGHSREACMRRTMTCRRCGQLGHIVVECEQPWNGGQATAPSLKCYFCGEAGHAVSRCPTITALKGLATSAASGTPTTPRN